MSEDEDAPPASGHAEPELEDPVKLLRGFLTAVLRFRLAARDAGLWPQEAASLGFGVGDLSEVWGWLSSIGAFCNSCFVAETENGAYRIEVEDDELQIETEGDEHHPETEKGERQPLFFFQYAPYRWWSNEADKTVRQLSATVASIAAGWGVSDMRPGTDEYGPVLDGCGVTCVLPHEAHDVVESGPRPDGLLVRTIVLTPLAIVEARTIDRCIERLEHTIAEREGAGAVESFLQHGRNVGRALPSGTSGAQS